MKRGRATSGEPLTLLLIAVSILGGVALAIACSYRPIALWWVMVACSAINVVRFGARYSRRARADRPDAPAALLRLAAVVTRALARSVDAFTGAKSGLSKASLDRQHTRFLVWFIEHNLLWTMIGFGASLLVWHRFGPTTPALVAMAALMTCGLFTALGAAAGATAPALGLCWREPCQTPDFLSPRRTVHDIGCVVVLKNRRDYAARCDWAKGGRFHELFLMVDDLARAGVEPGLEAVLAADDATALRALARKERVDRALALTPVFAAGLLAALVVVPPLAGSEPLPSLWTIVSMNANSRARPSANADDTPRDLPPGAAISPDERPASAKVTARSRRSFSEGGQAQNNATDRSRSQSSPRADGDAPSSSGHERPDITGQGGESSMPGDAVASARGNGAEETTGQGSGTPAGPEGSDAGNGAGSGSGGSGGASSSHDGPSGGSGGRGGGPRGYGTNGVAPQRAESPNALPDAPVNPGKAIEVVLPAFSQARGDSPDDDPTGTKRKARAPDQARVYQTRHTAGAAPNEPVTREPVQRLPNWIIQLLHK
jgi:uncharacterized membrane protein YgcG